MKEQAVGVRQGWEQDPSPNTLPAPTIHWTEQRRGSRPNPISPGLIGAVSLLITQINPGTIKNLIINQRVARMLQRKSLEGQKMSDEENNMVGQVMISST